MGGGGRGGGQRIAHFCLTVKGQDVGLVQSPHNISNGANLLSFLPSAAVNTAHHHTRISHGRWETPTRRAKNGQIVI